MLPLQESPDKQYPPEMTANFASRITFWWFTSFVLRGFRNEIKVSHMWRTLPSDQTGTLTLLFGEAWLSRPVPSRPSLKHASKSSTYMSASGSLQSKNNIALVIFKVVYPQLLVGAACKLVHDLLQYSTPMVLKLLLKFMSSKSEPQWHGMLYAIGLFVVPTVGSVFLSSYFFNVLRGGFRAKSMLIGALYRKSLVLSRTSRLQSTTGEITNLMAVDTQRFQDMFQNLNQLWSVPFQIMLSVILLYRELGWSVFAGVAIMSLMIPINSYIARRVKKLQLKLMTTKDKRIKKMNEILNGIKVIKLYAWEDSFMQLILKHRSTELHYLRHINYFEAIGNFFWWCSPFLVALVTFFVYLRADPSHVLTPEKAFVSISLINLLKLPLSMVPNLIMSSIVTLVSITRINEFLNADELVRYVERADCSIKESIDTNDKDRSNLPKEKETAILIKGGNLTWQDDDDDDDDDDDEKKDSGASSPSNSSTTQTADRNFAVYQQQRSPSASWQQHSETPTGGSKVWKGSPVLKNIDLEVKKGSFVAIIGQVASGKSSLLAAMLGEMRRLSGSFCIAKGARIAYVPQQAWIQNMSVRENILFGADLDTSRYKQCLSACSLVQDLETFPAGDRAQVGESGLNLSGGQKQRVSLARAIYSNSDIYLLDDPLSALDSHIAKHVFDKVLSSRTGLLKQTTRVLATNSLFVLEHVDHIVVLEDGQIVEAGSYAQLMAASDGRLSELMRGRAAAKSEIKSDATYDATSVASSALVTPPQKDDQKAAAEAAGQLAMNERVETGNINLKVYLSYFKIASLTWILIVLAACIMQQAFSVSTSLWLSKWSSEAERFNQSTSVDDKDQESGAEQQQTKGSFQSDNNTQLAVYAFLGAMQCLATLAASLSLSRAAIRGAYRMHSWLLTSIMHSPTTTFFDTTPTGRIVNRFAKDIDVVDSTLPFGLRAVVDCALGVLGTLFVVCYSFPLFLVIVAPVAIFYYLIQRVFIVTSRQLRRLESITRSPIYSNFGETLSGISVIRAFACEKRFVENADLLQDTNQICAYANVVANRWLSLRLELTGNVILFCAGLFSVFKKGSIETGLVGLAVSYSLSITGNLSWLVRFSSEAEANVVSVERILEYARNQSEDVWKKDSFRPELGWPTRGAVRIDNYSTRYRRDTNLVLRNLCLQVAAGEKIGVVGRTGSGKSSLSLALFRILEPTTGAIEIDGENICNAGLHDLRSQLTIIPQDSVLFSGSLRFNLDPLDLYTDEQLWRALELSHLRRYVELLCGKLQHPVSEYGENLSHGQRQLVCLARAVLRNSRIIVLDEATAAVDFHTDALVQKTIRQQFQASTILTIAHRLETILDSDRILVLEAGIVRELDTPARLAAEPSSAFASLLKSANIAPSAVPGYEAELRRRHGVLVDDERLHQASS